MKKVEILKYMSGMVLVPLPSDEEMCETKGKHHNEKTFKSGLCPNFLAPPLPLLVGITVGGGRGGLS